MSENQRVLPKRHTRTGWAVTTVHHSSVPGYDLADARRKLPTEADRRMELEIDWTSSRGKLVYPEFDRKTHVAREAIEFDPTLPLHCCWDLPGCPAFAPTQVNRYGQWCLFKPITQPEAEMISVYDFGQRVADHLLRDYALPFGLNLDTLSMVHIGDPAGNYRPQRTGLKRQETRAAFEVLKNGSKIYLGEDEDGRPEYEEKPGWGWRIQSGAVDHTTRQEAIRSRLTTLLPGGLPAFVVCPTAEEIIGALVGGYCFRDYEDGTFSREPLKNLASHLVNAIEYGATRLFARPHKPHKPDEDDPVRPPVVSQASNRSWR